MVFHFKASRYLLLLAGSGLLMIAACMTYDGAPDTYKFKMETQMSPVGFDTMPAELTQSNLLNAKDIRLVFQSVKYDKEQYYNPYTLEFADPDDPGNTLTVKLQGFFPETRSGIAVTPYISGSLNNQTGDPKLQVEYEYQGGVFTQSFLQVSAAGTCRLLFRRLRVKHSLILPSSPAYTMDVMLEFPKPEQQ
ncbi:MAG: hypothetical protein JNL57_08810 [Bacteroidetes bacterium]|nr:hypothetical protein [Bacteroidota bacterium]